MSEPEEKPSPPAQAETPASAQQPREWPLLAPMAIVKALNFHIVAYSVAGEESVVQIPELNINFDIGKCPRPALTSAYTLLTHGHIDHSAGIPYYLSQRFFQGMGPGTVLCPAKIAAGLSGIIHSWAALEGKVAEHRIVPMNVGDDFEIRRGLIARAFATRHTVPSLGYTIIDRREKLKPELLAQNLPGHILREMKDRGDQITYTLDVPIVAYTGDTSMPETLLQPGVRDAKVLITECTFFQADHKRRAQVGQHLHVADLLEALPQMENELILLSHLSRRTHIRDAKNYLRSVLREVPHRARVEFLMDHAQRLIVKPGKAASFVPVEREVPEDAAD